MNQFPNVRQPALGIQDAVMLPAQVGNLLMQRLASAEAAFVPMTTQTFNSTTSSTTLNGTTASSGGGSLRNLLMPMSNDGFVPIVPNPSPAFYNGPQFTQFGNQEVIAAILASQMGSSAGKAIFGACGVELPGPGNGPCGCQCVRELSEEVVIDEENSNGIDDGADMVMSQKTTAAAPATVVVNTIPVTVTQPAQAAAVAQTATGAAQVLVPVVNAQVSGAAPAEAVTAAQPASASIQYVTYNA